MTYARDIDGIGFEIFVDQDDLPGDALVYRIDGTKVSRDEFMAVLEMVKANLQQQGLR